VAENLFGTEVPATVNNNDSTPYTLGTRFTPQANGQITHIRWRVPDSAPSGNVTMGLYRNSDSVLLSSTTVSVAAAAGTWTQVALPSPVSVTSGAAYTAVVFTPDRYVSTNAYAWPKNNGANLISANPGGWYNGNFAIAFPNDNFGGANYFADVVFELPSSGVAATGRTSAAAVAGSSASKRAIASARCCAAARISAASRKAAPVTARAAAVATGRVTVRHAGVVATRAVSANSATAVAAKRIPATATTLAAASAVAAVSSGSARPVVATCSACPLASVLAVRATRAVAAVTVVAAPRVTTSRRTPAVARALVAARSLAASARRTAVTARTVAVVSATAAAGQVGATRPVTGRCVAAAFGRARITRITRRPAAGTTARPSSGTKARPFAGVTYRP
jgi:hypothetical protein